MREIKFRAWHKSRKQMLPVIEIKFGSKPDLDHIWGWSGKDVDSIFGLGPQQYDLMQYTGLKDKNGKEIYEGDIVQGLGANQGMRKDIGMHSFCGWPNIPADRWEVIGNIYENKELLD